MPTTKTKVTLAALAYRIIAFARGLAGKSKSAIVRRGGICWDLDLSEGIDFSIYLLGAFEPGTAKTLQELVKPGDVVFDIGANIGGTRCVWRKAPAPQEKYMLSSRRILRSQN
jgi:hypothetical protein